MHFNSTEQGLLSFQNLNIEKAACSWSINHPEDQLAQKYLSRNGKLSFNSLWLSVKQEHLHAYMH